MKTEFKELLERYSKLNRTVEQKNIDCLKLEINYSTLYRWTSGKSVPFKKDQRKFAKLINKLER